MKRLFLLMILIGIFLPQYLFAAVGCTLSNPAEDLKYLFPEMTSFKEELRNFETIPEGKKYYQDLKDRLKSDLDPIYETFETPYTIYLVFKREELIGLVHGVNIPGKGGVIQVFLSSDPVSGEIRNFFFQRLESPVAKELKKKEFREQFKYLTLADWYKHDYYKVAGKNTELDKLSNIKPPPSIVKEEEDYQASLRGIKKNLILLDIFFYQRKFEPFYQRALKALKDNSKN